MTEDQQHHQQMPPHNFTPWDDSRRSCWTCAHSIGYDGTHLWCQRARLVVVYLCGSWARGAGCDNREG